MTIPNFKSNQDWEEFSAMFDARWHCKKALLDRVKDDLYGRQGFKSLSYNELDSKTLSYNELDSKTLEVINDIVQSLLYDTEFEFEQSHPDYKRDMDDIFVPRNTFKQEVTDALLEANKKFWNQSNDTLTEVPD